jgi:hypothetical protein
MIDSLSDGGAERVLVAVAPRLHEGDWDVTVDVLIDRVDPGLAATLQRSGVDVRVHGVERLASPAAWRTVDRLLRDVDLASCSAGVRNDHRRCPLTSAPRADGDDPSCVRPGR